MPLRSDFTIHAETPDPPEITETIKIPRPARRRMRGIPVTWQGTEVTWPPSEQIRLLHLGGLARLPELEDIGESFESEPAPAGEQVRRVAFLVVHGMGQQVPFETLSMLGQALITQDDERKRKCGEARPVRAAGDDPRVNVRRVKLTHAEGAPELSRGEVQFRDEKLPPVDVHLYESYWAPLTEGQISFLQTVAFLYTAAWNGIRTSFWQWRRKSCDADEPALSAPKAGGGDKQKHFDRWMFGKFRDMPIKRGTYGALLGVVLAVSVLLIPAILVFTPVGTSVFEKFGGWLWHGALHWRWWGRCLLGLGAALFLAVAWWVHYFVVEYVGDVAIYVSSYKVSRFQAIRDKIQEAVRTVAQQIYSAGMVDGRHPAYDEVVLVGHSLGSVIAYDALNEAINWDEVECGFSRKVVGRTTRLVTFGSPLDKTAFLFRTQVSSARNLREALAARQQPLILNYGSFRPRRTFRWINIWSSRDYISGRLDYYDIAKCEARDPSNQKYGRRNPVINCTDPDARRPMLAHVQYWENSKLHKVLYRAVWARAHTLVAAGAPGAPVPPSPASHPPPP